MAVYFQKREVVVPGQLLAEGRYRSSFGTYDDEGKIFSSLVGLAELRGNTVKVVALEGSYIPKEGDLVIATINIVAGNNWKVNIGGPYGASLHANNALRRPYSDDISEYMDIGDVISAEIIAFDRNSGPFLGMKGRGLTVLTDGMVLEVSPAKIPRIIGRSGSMINMINDHLKIDTIVGQNGRIWIRAPSTEILRLAIKAFRTIETQAHTSRLTDRISSMLVEELEKIKGSVETKEEVQETAELPETEPESEPELDTEAEPVPAPESKTDSKEKPEPETPPEKKDTTVEVEAKKDEEKEEPTEEVSKNES